MLTDICAGGVCEEGSFTLYESQTTTFDFGTTVSGTPLACFGGQYAALCDDDTTDPSSASILCTAFEYYGQQTDLYFSFTLS